MKMNRSCRLPATTWLVLATYATLLCLVPVAHSAKRQTNSDAEVVPFESSWQQTEIVSPQNANHNHYADTLDGGTAAEDLPKERIPSRRRKLRGRSKSAKLKALLDDYYQDMEKQIASSASSHPAINGGAEQASGTHMKFLESDKKYFDYFPIEDVELNYDPKEDDIRVILITGDDDNADASATMGIDDDVKKRKSKKFTDSMKKHQYTLDSHSRRRRDTRAQSSSSSLPSDHDNDESTNISKRNVGYSGYSPFEEYLSSLSANTIQRGGGGADIRRQTFNFQSGNAETVTYHTQGSANDPWNNRFIPPYNFYLPVPPPVYVPPQIPNYVNWFFCRYPIPGIYFNPNNGGYLPPSRPSPQPEQPQPQPQQPSSNPGQTTTTTNNGGVTLGSRGGFGADEDRVIWDVEPNNPDQYSPGSFGGQGSSGFSTTPAPPRVPEPTRPSTQSTRRTQPPLIHRPQRPTTATRASTFAPTDSFSPQSEFGGGFNNIFQSDQSPQRRQPESQPPRAQIRPFKPANSIPSRVEAPTRCIWGIVSCCARNNLAVRYSCFEQLGCHGAFWDLNPCADNLQDAALEETGRFFDRK